MPLRDLKTKEHPLTWKEFKKLIDEVEDAATGFLMLGYPELALHLNTAKHSLVKAWNEIKKAEDEGL